MVFGSSITEQGRLRKLSQATCSSQHRIDRTWKDIEREQTEAKEPTYYLLWLDILSLGIKIEIPCKLSTYCRFASITESSLAPEFSDGGR